MHLFSVYSNAVPNGERKQSKKFRFLPSCNFGSQFKRAPVKKQLKCIVIRLGRDFFRNSLEVSSRAYLMDATTDQFHQLANSIFTIMAANGGIICYAINGYSMIIELEPNSCYVFNNMSIFFCTLAKRDCNY